MRTSASESRSSPKLPAELALIVALSYSVKRKDAVLVAQVAHRFAELGDALTQLELRESLLTCGASPADLDWLSSLSFDAET